MLLRQIYSILVFLFTQSLSLVHINMYACALKACNHTPRGCFCAPTVGHAVFLTLPPQPKGDPVPSHTHACTHTHTETYVRHSEEVQCASGGGKKVLDSDCEA